MNLCSAHFWNSQKVAKVGENSLSKADPFIFSVLLESDRAHTAWEEAQRLHHSDYCGSSVCFQSSYSISKEVCRPYQE